MKFELVYLKYINFKCNIEYHSTVLYYNNTLIKYFACTVVLFTSTHTSLKRNFWFNIITYFIYIVYFLSVHTSWKCTLFKYTYNACNS